MLMVHNRVYPLIVSMIGGIGDEEAEATEAAAANDDGAKDLLWEPHADVISRTRR